MRCDMLLVEVNHLLSLSLLAALQLVTSKLYSKLLYFYLIR